MLACLVQDDAVMAGARKPEDFAAWQLAWELKGRIVAFTSIPPALHDRKFCEEIMESARSGPDNICEGYYRFSPPDFANFVRMARGSLGEVRNQLTHAKSKKYLSDDEFSELIHLCERAIRAATGLRLYLLSCPKNFDPRKPKPEPGTKERATKEARTKEPGT